MIIDIRGTNGSGKSHIVHTMLGMYDHLETEYHHESLGSAAVTSLPQYNLAVIGRYRTQCGGADGITSQQLITRMVEFYADKGDVIVEGSIVGSVFSRWNDLAARLVDYHFLLLNTPVELCIERVVARRAAAGNPKPFDPNKTLIPRFNTIIRLAKQLEDAGRSVRWIDHRGAVNEVEMLLSQSRSMRL